MDNEFLLFHRIEKIKQIINQFGEENCYLSFKGCPFALKLQDQLDVMERLLPREKEQCERIWKPVYDEYRRLNYRLKKIGDDNGKND